MDNQNHDKKPGTAVNKEETGLKKPDDNKHSSKKSRDGEVSDFDVDESTGAGLKGRTTKDEF